MSQVRSAFKKLKPILSAPVLSNAESQISATTNVPPTHAPARTSICAAPEAVAQSAALEETGETIIHEGSLVHIPAAVFPEHVAPECGFWSAKTVRTKKGGKEDVGFKVDGEKEIFTRPKTEVRMWLVQS